MPFRGRGNQVILRPKRERKRKPRRNTAKNMAVEPKLYSGENVIVSIVKILQKKAVELKLYSGENVDVILVLGKLISHNFFVKIMRI